MNRKQENGNNANLMIIYQGMYLTLTHSSKLQDNVPL